MVYDPTLAKKTRRHANNLRRSEPAGRPKNNSQPLSRRKYSAERRFSVECPRRCKRCVNAVGPNVGAAAAAVETKNEDDGGNRFYETSARAVGAVRDEWPEPACIGCRQPGQTRAPRPVISNNSTHTLTLPAPATRPKTHTHKTNILRFFFFFNYSSGFLYQVKRVFICTMWKTDFQVRFFYCSDHRAKIRRRKKSKLRRAPQYGCRACTHCVG